MIKQKDRDTILRWLINSIKNDKKKAWTIIFLVGTLLGYNIPSDLNKIFPEVPVSVETARQLEKRLEKVEIKVFGTIQRTNRIVRKRPLK
tara:strand:+ start:317 stop:586 length:270 start_codon:yes stop_codon:yes gene_type:complete